MTKQQWLTSDRPAEMLTYLRDWANPRKLRLFGAETSYFFTMTSAGGRERTSTNLMSFIDGMQRKTGMGHKAVAIFCYMLALAGQIAFLVLVILLGIDEFSREALPSPWPWLIDLGWLALFAVKHSGMARAGFKMRWARIISPSLERSVYAGVSGLLLLGLSVTWQPLPGEPLWHLPVWVLGIALATIVGMGLYSLGFDHLGFFGLRKEEETFRIVGPYRFLRHPLMVCQIVFLWAQPVMSPTLAVLSAGLTLYILLAIPLEERDLRRRFGSAYEEYQRRVPALIPWRRPIPPAIHKPGNP